jgi:hypothetical protein
MSHQPSWYFILFYFIVVLVRSRLWHLQRFLQYIKYIILELLERDFSQFHLKHTSNQATVGTAHGQYEPPPQVLPLDLHEDKSSCNITSSFRVEASKGKVEG